MTFIRPDFYVPYRQRAQHRSDFVVKTAGDPLALANAVRQEVFAIDIEQPISNVTTMGLLVDQALARARFNSMVLGALAVCAVLLAGIGLYGVLSYSISQRTAEIGIRMALGATPLGIVRLVAGEGVTLVAGGAALGLAAALVARDLVRSQLFGVSAVDPASYAATAAILLAVSLAASVLPAARASGTDPARAMRSDG